MGTELQQEDTDQHKIYFRKQDDPKQVNFHIAHFFPFCVNNHPMMSCLTSVFAPHEISSVRAQMLSALSTSPSLVLPWCLNIAKAQCMCNERN